MGVNPLEQRYPIEETGRTVEEAVERALTALGLQREAVLVEILDEGSRGVLGIGAREAKVRISPRHGRLPTVTAVATDLVTRMGFVPTIGVEDGPESVRVAVEGDNLGALIGKHGQTLAAIEALVALIAGRRLGGPIRVDLDVMSYRERRRSTLEALARRTAVRVARSGREVALAPMEARDRRIVHVALQDDPNVSTESRGEGEVRRVVIMPKSTGGEAGVGEPQKPDAAEKGRDPQEPEIAPRGKGAGAGSVRRPERSGNANQTQKRGNDARAGRYQDRSAADNRARGQTRRPPAAGLRSGRPEGLPIDEELDAEIEAHLERMRQRASERSEQPTDKPSREPKAEGPDTEA